MGERMEWIRRAWFNIWHIGYSIDKPGVATIIIIYKRYSKRKVHVIMVPDGSSEQIHIGWIDSSHFKTFVQGLVELPDGIAIRNYVNQFIDQLDEDSLWCE
jgi:hypothetical protein